jgi:Cof subfamily protein (haloacid dehalogenase superfamily)
MLKILKELDLKAPVAAFNGGMYFDPSKLPDIHVILEKVLPEDVCRQIVGRLEREGHDVWIYRKQDWFVRDVNAAHVAKETRTVEFSPTVVPNFEGLFDQVVKIVGVSDQTEKLDEIGKTLGREFKGKASASLSQPYYLDITHPQANKGEVVRFFSQFFGVQGTQVATLGDMPNDVSMFKASGLSIAMGNSDDFVKSSALEVTDSYDDDGFAHAIEKVLKKQAS